MDKALLVGINAYRSAPLKGCVNDISMMANLLVTRFRMQKRSIRMLADGRATTKNILRELEWLIDGLKAGDRCVFHFSGHGAQVPTKNRRLEVDGRDEIVCPSDFDWSPRRLIRDKQFYGIFRRLPPGVKFAWVNDSCHSGDLTRAIPKNIEIPRTIPVPPDVAWDIDVAKEEKICCVEMSPCNDVMNVHSRAVEKGVLEVGFVSGCRSNQTSADTVINGIPCGALTWHLVNRLKSMPKKTPLVKVVKAVSSDLARKRYSQRPQAEGTRKSKPFLG